MDSHLWKCPRPGTVEGSLSMAGMEWDELYGLFQTKPLEFCAFIKLQFVFPISGRTGTILEGGFSKACAWMFNLGNGLAFAGRWSEIETGVTHPQALAT